MKKSDGLLSSLKKIGLKIFYTVLTPFALCILFAEYLGLLFAASIIVVAVVGWGFGIPEAFDYLSIMWKVYAGLGIFTFLFLTTLHYQHCCVGIQRFGDHLKHRGWKGVGQDFFGATIWPWSWFVIDRNLRGWGLCLVDVMINAVVYWVVDWWRGINITVIEMRTGKTVTTRAKTPEATRDTIRDTIIQNLPKEG